MVTSKNQKKSNQVPFWSPKVRLFFPSIFGFNLPSQIFFLGKKIIGIFFRPLAFIWYQYVYTLPYIFIVQISKQNGWLKPLG